ncbi:hypothetical protein EKG40_25825 [Pseudomonas moorei]|nr:hypothetical protein EKG40_25825 [Pseudomonas moorei]
MKTATDEISKKQIYLLTFATNGTLWFFVFCIIMPIAWYCSGSALIGIALALAIPAFLIKRSADKRINLVNKMLNEIYNKTMSSLENVDYYYYHANGSIAVDAKNGLISYIKALPTMDILPPVIINAGDITEYYFYDPGMTTTKYHGRDLALAQETITDNLKSMAARTEERGLHIRANDLKNPKIIMAMAIKEADHWTLILKMVIDQTLEPTNRPTMIP